MEFRVLQLSGLFGSNIILGDINKTLDISSIVIDSRLAVSDQGSVFFALKGVRHDGHQFVNDLYDRGIRIFVISEIPDSIMTDAVYILVDDTLEALHTLASYVRKQYSYPVVGITGSNGKTIVKEWLFDLLQNDTRIVRNPLSYNSQVGVPLSVWNMTADYDLAIFEAGISQPGEMAKLYNIMRPTIGIFTNLGDAHQENFKSQENKLNEKFKLFKSCKLIIYRKDLESVHSFASKYKAERLFSWSFYDENANLLIAPCKSDSSTRLNFSFSGNKFGVVLPFTDDASIENACHCIAFILAIGRWNEYIAGRFQKLQPVAMRLELKAGINDCTLINDYYNADINSLEVALRFLNQQVDREGRRTLILSDIRQSGLATETLMNDVAQLVRSYHISKLIGIGETISVFSHLFDNEVYFYRSTDDFIENFEPDSFKNECILLKGARDFRFERIAALLQKKHHQTCMEVDLNAMVENLNRYKKLLKPETKVMAMVKAFSYGSGSVEIARALEFHKIDYLAVAVADEGIELRQAGIKTPIIVMNPEEHSFEQMLEYRLEPNLYSKEIFEKFEMVARRMAVMAFPVHLKLETGMNRLGFNSKQELTETLKSMSGGNLRVCSVFSHLAVSDDPEEDDYTKKQYDRFSQLYDVVVDNHPYPVIRHLLNSAGIERFSKYQMEMVRLGIGLYGVAQSPALQAVTVARWMTIVSQVKTVEAGDTIGYGRRGKAVEPKTIAIIPVGYADGYDRRLSNGVGKIWINGQFFPVIGNVCMDMTMIDVTGSDVKSGDQVELMGDNVKLQQLAGWMGTIPYEVLTGISQRVKRIYVLHNM